MCSAMHVCVCVCVPVLQHFCVYLNVKFSLVYGVMRVCVLLCVFARACVCMCVCSSSYIGLCV